MTTPFLYFGFGSNLDGQRLHIHCPSARFLTTARLPDHRLAFSIESKNTWLGGVADIRPEPGAEVWGALWLIDRHHSEPLDRQEGLFRDPPAYRRVRVTVDSPGGDTVSCRSYQVVAPDPVGYLPSRSYLETMLRGARAVGLPQHYFRALGEIEHNGIEGVGPPAEEGSGGCARVRGGS